jgi:hypothetical protein
MTPPELMAVSIVDRSIPEGAMLHLARPGHMSGICGAERYTNADVVEPDTKEALKIFARGVIPGWLGVSAVVCDTCAERARDGPAW